MRRALFCKRGKWRVNSNITDRTRVSRPVGKYIVRVDLRCTFWQYYLHFRFIDNCARNDSLDRNAHDVQACAGIISS